MKKKKVYLTLQNGKVFQGYALGADGEATGELVFSTSAVGYIEGLTDPANYGQILVQTFPLIGNYGMIEKDAESERACVSAYVVRELCDQPSNFRSEGDVNAYLTAQGVVGICGVDTRELTKILREEGAMNARISKKPLSEAELVALANYEVRSAVASVSPCEVKTFGEAEKGRLALWNFGEKQSAINALTARGFEVISFPAFVSADEILSSGADGVVLSGGPGDPTENVNIVAEIQKLVGKLPVLGLGLGHQLLALALGGKTYKQKHGHRGSNQPVKSLQTGRVYVSAQNHGYAVDADSLSQAELLYVNVNDGSCEGLFYADKNALGVQFDPTSCIVGLEESPVYEQFFAMIAKEKKNA